MINVNQTFKITVHLARKLIAKQFPSYAHLPITSVKKQGHDNRTYRLGDKMLIRMPTNADYALKVSKEQELLPKLAPYLSVNIPVPIKMGIPSKDYPYPFSIYKWLEGESINLLKLNDKEMQQLAFDLAKFLKELQSINNISGSIPGQHNWWRGDRLIVYDKNAREQIKKLIDIIDANKAISLWQRACNTEWNRPPVWVHGDIAIGNILLKNGKLSAVIDFGGMALGDPACDLVIAWTFFIGKSRSIFIQEMALDEDTWLRARGWALWKVTFELCQVRNRNKVKQKKIIKDLLT